MKPTTATDATGPSRPISMTRVPSEATVEYASTAFSSIARNACRAPISMVRPPKATSVAPTQGAPAKTWSIRARR